MQRNFIPEVNTKSNFEILKQYVIPADVLKEMLNIYQMIGKGDVYKETLEEKAYVYHYGGPNKPWIIPNIFLGDIWWTYARKTPYYEIILDRYFQKKSSKFKMGLLFTKYFFK